MSSSSSLAKLGSRENIYEPDIISKDLKVRDIQIGNQLPESKRKLIKRNQIIIFFLTFTAYSLIHSTRTIWSASKPFVKEQFIEIDWHFLGIMDSCFLLSLAISMCYLSSHMRKAKVQHAFGAGIISTSICFMLLFAVCQFKLNPISLIFLMLLNGVSQSVGWPYAIQSLGNWFNKSKKGLLMGLWTTCSNFGNIIGYLIMDFTINQIHQNWTFSLLLIGLLTLSMGLFVYHNMESHPQDVGISIKDFSIYYSLTQQDKQNNNPPSELVEKQAISSSLQDNAESQHSPNTLNQPMDLDISDCKEIQISPLQEAQEAEKSLDKNQITVLNAWLKIPELAVFSLIISGLKGIIYGKLFWLPLYLSQKGFKRHASLICSMSELGTLIGGLLLGFLIDKFKAQAIFITLFIATSTVSMLTIHFLPALENPLPYYLLILIAGIGLGGPFAFIGGAKAIEIASNKEVAHKKNITALVAGMLEGFGSVIAAFVQLLVPFIGLSRMFILFSILSGLSCVILISRVLKEVKNIC